MDRSLWLLWALRSWSWLRRWIRNLRTLKGVLLALVGSLVFLPMLGASLLAPNLHGAGHLALVRRIGPLVLAGWSALNLLLATGERAVTFSPAEVDFLFAGPYRQRQLLLYKIVASVAGAALSAIVLALVLGHHASSTWAAYLGSVLALEFLYLSSMAVSLLATTIGVLAFDRARKLVLAALVVLIVSTLIRAGGSALSLTPWRLFELLESSTVVQLVLLPFRPFVMTFTAERAWPDLATAFALALGIEVALTGFVLVLNARYYEASAAASARLYARLRRARRGGGWSRGGSRVRFEFPMVPWWGGVGPNLWRQLTTASRNANRIIGLLIFLQLPIFSIVLTIRSQDPASLAAFAISTLVSVALFAPTMTGFDFRPDVERMEALKTLPITATRVVVGQIATPILILTLGEWLTLALIALLANPNPWLLGAVSSLIVPFNVLLVEVENLFFLWYPVQHLPLNSIDFQTMGRQMLLMMAKCSTVLLVSAVAAGIGGGAYFVLGGSWSAALLAGWVAVAGAAWGLLPLLAQAFRQYDVARDAPT